MFFSMNNCENLKQDRKGEQDLQKNFTIFLNEHIAYLTNYARKLSKGDDYLVEELLQETLFKAYRSYIEDPGRPLNEAWIFTILRNKYIDLVRKQNRRLTFLLLNEQTEAGTEYIDCIHFPGKYDSPETWANNPSVGKAPQTLEDIDKDFLRAHFSNEVAEALLDNDISNKQRRVSFLRLILNLKFQQIAELEGIPANTAKSRDRYARRQLMGRLQAYAREIYDIGW